jgi:MFS family permease
MTGRVARLASKEIVSATALALGALGVALSPHLLFIPAVYLPSLLMGIGYGISLPLLMAMMSEYAPPGQRGVAMGLRTQANQVAATITPIAFGTVFPAVGITLGFLLAAIGAWAMLGAGVWIHLVDRREQQRQTVPPPEVAATAEGD